MNTKTRTAFKPNVCGGANKLLPSKSEITKGDNLERQGGSGSQERNQEGRRPWETRRHRQLRAKSSRKTNFTDKAAAASKSENEIMKGDKLGRQGGRGSQKRNHEETNLGDKLGTQGGSGIQKWKPRGRQAWETRRQRRSPVVVWDVVILML